MAAMTSSTSGFAETQFLHHHQPFFTLNLNGKAALINRNAGWLRSEVSSMS